MVKSQSELSRKDVFFMLYMVVMFISGWYMDTNALFLSKYFNLAGFLSTTIIGGFIGFIIFYVIFRSHDEQ